MVAYELLSGAHPFAGRSGASQLIAAHLAETPQALQDRVATLPQDVAALVMQCLAKAPSDRPESAAAVLSRLSYVTTPNAAQAPSAPRAVPPSPRVRRAWLVAPALTVLLVVAWAVSRQRADTSPIPATSAITDDVTTPVRSLVVLPFESVGGDTANAYFGEGMADELSNALMKVPGLQLVGRSSALAFRGRNASPQDIGTALKVGGVLEGTVRRSGNRLRVSSQLTNTRTGLVMWSKSFERDARDVFAVQDDITKAIVRALQVTLSGAEASAPVAARGTTSLEAYDLYQRGMYFYQRRGPGLTRAREYFEQAIKKDPAFVRAHAGLGLTWIALAIYSDVSMSDAIPRALAAGERAVALDSMSADGWAAVGQARTYQHRWAEADVATQRAVQLDARSLAGQLYRSRFLLATGRVEEAVASVLLAVETDPVNAVSLGYAALTLSISGRHAEAIAAGNRAWEIDSTVAGVTSYSLVALVDGGQMVEAQRRAEIVLRMAREITGLSGATWAIGATGDRARAATLAREYMVRFASNTRLQSTLTGAWLAAGDTARALDAMERAADRLEMGVVNMPLALRRYDPLRASPRFAAIVRKLGLDVALFTSPTGGRPR